MKCSRADVYCKTHSLPVLRFEEPTHFVLGPGPHPRAFPERLRRCFEHLVVSPIFGHATVVLSLVLHLLMGFRELRAIRYYADDPLVRRTLGLRRPLHLFGPIGVVFANTYLAILWFSGESIGRRPLLLLVR